MNSCELSVVRLWSPAFVSGSHSFDKRQQFCFREPFGPVDPSYKQQAVYSSSSSLFDTTSRKSEYLRISRSYE